MSLKKISLLFLILITALNSCLFTNDKNETVLEGGWLIETSTLNNYSVLNGDTTYLAVDSVIPDISKSHFYHFDGDKMSVYSLNDSCYFFQSSTFELSGDTLVSPIYTSFRGDPNGDYNSTDVIFRKEKDLVLNIIFKSRDGLRFSYKNYQNIYLYSESPISSWPNSHCE